MKKIVVAIDSFKGSLSSAKAGQAATEGIYRVLPDCEVVMFPVADGGEGTLATLMATSQGYPVTISAHNPLMQPIQTEYGITRDRQTALIEMAATCGLTLVQADQRNPLLTTTYGLGEVIGDALDKGCRNFIIVIGGSATNDAGIGMLQALGYQFLNAQGKTLGTGGKIMADIVKINSTNIHRGLKEAHFAIACDVDNPFHGPNGAACVYARQKGADDQMIGLLDKGMESFTKVIHAFTGKDISSVPGSGAARGLGGGFLAFLNAELRSGTELLLDALSFAKHIANADLIVTGEGRADHQTIRGKTAFGILKEAQKQHIPVVLIAGSIEDVELLNQSGFQGVFSITPGPVTLNEAMEADFASENISRLVTQICRTIGF